VQNNCHETLKTYTKSCIIHIFQKMGRHVSVCVCIDVWGWGSLQQGKENLFLSLLGQEI
jgi:hypothetical protein